MCGVYALAGKDGRTLSIESVPIMLAAEGAVRARAIDEVTRRRN